LSTRLDAYDGGSGIFGFRSDQLSAELKRIKSDREILERRLGALEDRMSKRFSALDSLVAQFQSTGNYLTQQMASLTNLYKAS
jgi:flagellar hook-associated protein 2